MSQTTFDISLIVPTYNRAESLKRLLKSIDSLEVPDGVRLEVVVVNNASSDDTERVLAEAENLLRKFSIKVFREEMRGQSSAINRGLRECRGEIVCLLDDDVVLDSGWVEGLLRSYRLTDFDAFQGRVLAGVDPCGNAADPNKLYYYNIPVVDRGDKIRSVRGLTGAHMTFKRRVMDKVGCFDVRLGPGASGFSGDTEFSARVRKAGFKIGYTPFAVAYHELNPQRYGRKYNRAVQYRKGQSRSHYRDDSILLSVLPKLLVNSVRYCACRLVGDERIVYRAEGRIFRSLGYLRSWLYRFTRQPNT